MNLYNLTDYTDLKLSEKDFIKYRDYLAPTINQYTLLVSDTVSFPLSLIYPIDKFSYNKLDHRCEFWFKYYHWYRLHSTELSLNIKINQIILNEHFYQGQLLTKEEWLQAIVKFNIEDLLK